MSTVGTVGTVSAVGTASTLRVLFPFVGVQIGGAVVSASEMMRRMVAEGGVEPMALVPREGPSAKLFRSAGVEPVFHDSEAVSATTLRRSTIGALGKLQAIPTYLAVYRQALRSLRRHAADVVHVNEDRLVLPWGLAARRAGVPLVWHVRQERPNRLLDGLRTRLSDHMVFVAEANKVNRFAGSSVRLPPNTTIYNVVDLQRFQPAGDVAAAKRAAGLDPERLCLTFVGNLFARKRPDWVLRAAAELQRRHRLQVVLIGAPLGPADYLREVEGLAAATPEPEHVHLLGARDDVPDLLRASDVLTLPSAPLGEAFPRAVIEAQASGVPVVATDVAGMREAVEDGVAGVIVDPADFGAYVEALDFLLGNGQLRKALGRSGRAAAEERFSGSTMVARLVEIYRSVLRLDVA